jgi:hypothetical protein
VPVIAPVVELMLSPSGKLVAEYVNGAIPPVIAGPLPLYGWFIVPAGFDAHASDSGGALITMVHWMVCVCAVGLVESVTVTLYGKLP